MSAESSGVSPLKDDDADSSIEKVFDLLKEGKQFQSQNDFWNAADKFVQAQDMLKSLAQDNSRGTEEEQEIAGLYKQQAREYLFQSRQCLIEAMSKERSDDEDNDGELLTCLSLSEEQAENRTRIFAMLFSKHKVPTKPKDLTPVKLLQTSSPLPSAPPTPLPSAPHEPDDQQLSLEERLNNLNASIPTGLKTSDERLVDLNKGLNRLGLSLYPQKEPFARFKEELPKGEDEQIEDIMQQVQDEVAVEKQFGEASKVLGKKPDDDEEHYSDSDDENDDEEEKGDELLEDEQLAMKTIRRQIERAQTKLAQAVAYLDEAKAAKDKEDEEEGLVNTVDDDDDDGDSMDGIIKPDYTTYLAFSKKNIWFAQHAVKKALAEWKENLS